MPDEHQRVGLERLGELPHQPRLPDACLPNDSEQASASLLHRPVEGRAQLGQLGRAADHRRIEAAGKSGTPGNHIEEPPRGEPAARRPRGLGAPQARSGSVLDETPGTLADQDLALGGRLLQPCGHPDRVPGGDRLTAAGSPTSTSPVSRPARAASRIPQVALQLLVDRCELTAQLNHGSHRPQGVVFVGDRDPEDRHDNVTDQLLDGAPVLCDDIGCAVDSAADNPSEGFRVQACTPALVDGDRSTKATVTVFRPGGSQG